jgi:hypothetical protein
MLRRSKEPFLKEFGGDGGSQVSPNHADSSPRRMMLLRIPEYINHCLIHTPIAPSKKERTPYGQAVLPPFKPTPIGGRIDDPNRFISLSIKGQIKNDRYFHLIDVTYPGQASNIRNGPVAVV